MSASNWLLLQVKPRQEMRALENLERQQAQCYCPLIQVEKLSRGKRIQVEEPLFSGYLFINAQPELNGLSYTSIRSSRGVSKIVGFGAAPIVIPQSLIEQLKLRESNGLAWKAENVPQAGDKVNIIEGPFKGLQAVYSHTDGQQRAIVLINLLHQQAPTSLANTQIQKIA
ncbi:transcription/translation regulatory transformer protein RfaH [Oceanospirillaceae bacterium]|nr:transcription/translation regulatory transformer protein RfaH [Oceanospirillaceae bacterium]